MQLTQKIKLAILFGLFSSCSFASVPSIGDTSYRNQQVNEILVRIINQLKSAEELAEKGESIQPKNQRYSFAFGDFTTYDGVSHLGLISEIGIVQNGIKDFINKQNKNIHIPLKANYQFGDINND